MTNNSPRICGIRARNGGAEIALSVCFSDGVEEEKKTYLLTMEQYLEHKFRRAEELSEERLECLETAAAFSGALLCGERLLACAPSPEAALARKIAQHGFDRKSAADAARYLAEHGMIDELSLLRRETDRCLTKLWGERRIRSYLWTRGYAAKTLEQLPDILLDVPFADRCATLIRKHYGGLPESCEDRQKLSAALARYGYSPSDIREAIRLLSQ